MSPEYIVGVNIGFHDSSACLLRHGSVRIMVEQERVSRRKRAIAENPADAVRSCLAAEGITSNDVDALAIGWDFRDTPIGRTKRFSDQVLWESLLPDRRRPSSAVRWVPHHLAHAASGFYSSGTSDAAIIVVDGAGERTASTIARGSALGIDVVREWPIAQSLGFFFAAATRWAGFGDWGAGKLMGLAAYGRPRDGLPVRATADGYEIVVDGRPLELSQTEGRAVRGPMLSQFPDYEKALLGSFAAMFPYAERDVAAGEGAIAYADFAASAQEQIEQALLGLATAARTAVDVPTLVLTGGVAMNCSMIGALVRSGVFEHVYVPPVPTDVGVALGAALVVAEQQQPFRPVVIDHPYWSVDITGEQARIVVDAAGLPSATLADDELIRVVAAAIAEGRIVGWSRGRGEIGERALGSRSILADPRSRQTLQRLNTLKGREMWRPVAPSVLSEHLDEVMETPVGHPARFMLAAGTVRRHLRTAIPAVTHVDGTARPQLVDRATNPLYWGLIERFRVLTGIPLVVNTSFNLAGEPIVSSAADAMSTFRRSEDMDLLVLDNMLVARTPDALAACLA